MFLAYLVFYAFSGYYMLVLFTFYLLSSIYGMLIYFLLSLIKQGFPFKISLFSGRGTRPLQTLIQSPGEDGRPYDID